MPNTDNNPKSAIVLFNKERSMLVDLLFACSVMSRKESRDIVVVDLRETIKGPILRDYQNDRLDIRHIVDACLNNSSGLEVLIGIIKGYEDGTISFQALESFVQELFVRATKNKKEEQLEKLKSIILEIGLTDADLKKLYLASAPNDLLFNGNWQYPRDLDQDKVLTWIFTQFTNANLSENSIHPILTFAEQLAIHTNDNDPHRSNLRKWVDDVVPTWGANVQAIDELRTKLEHSKELEKAVVPTSNEANLPSALDKIRAADFGGVDRWDLTDWLFKCQNMDRREARMRIINDLPEQIRTSRLRDDQNDRLDIRGIVDACLNYSGGLKELMTIVSNVENDSEQWQEVENYLEGFLQRRHIVAHDPEAEKQINQLTALIVGMEATINNADLEKVYHASAPQLDFSDTTWRYPLDPNLAHVVDRILHHLNVAPASSLGIPPILIFVERLACCTQDKQEKQKLRTWVDMWIDNQAVPAWQVKAEAIIALRRQLAENTDHAAQAAELFSQGTPDEISMTGTQPNNQNVFERTRLELHLGPGVLVSRSGFRLCKTTIKKIHKILSDNDEWEIQEDDLTDYSNSLRAVRSTLKEFKSSRFGPLYPFGKIISILDQAKRSLGGALGIKNVHVSRRTKYIQEFRTNLENAISMMEWIETLKGFKDISP